MIKNILLLFFLTSISISAFSQTSFSVTSSGLSFTPSSLNINVGDTVVWTNLAGMHNVNGTTTAFSSNPASFSNGAASSAAWTYTFVFTIAGTYNYQCDVHASSGMTGTITVSNPSSIVNLNINENISLYPNPFSNTLSIELDKSVFNDNNNNNIEFSLFDILGSQVYKAFRVTSEFTQIDTDKLPNGIYIYSFKSEGRVVKTGKLTK